MAARRPENSKPQRGRRPTPTKTESPLRIIGGRLRGRSLLTPEDPRTRPMKERVREAVFNLVGKGLEGMRAIDLFAGSGALGLEAISRGAERATLIERHFPTAGLIRQNVRQLQVEDRVEVVAADAFLWVRQDLPDPTLPWIVFCSPPYDFYVERQAEMLRLLQTLVDTAPPHSLLVVESDARFDTDLLPPAVDWDVRCYSPAVVAVAVLPGHRCDP